MDKLSNYGLELAFLAILIRMLLLGTGIGEAIVAISLVISITYKKFYLGHKKIEDKEQIMNEIDSIKGAISSLRIQTSTIVKKSNEKETHSLNSVRRF